MLAVLGDVQQRTAHQRDDWGPIQTPRRRVLGPPGHPLRDADTATHQGCGTHRAAMRQVNSGPVTVRASRTGIPYPAWRDDRLARSPPGCNHLLQRV